MGISALVTLGLRAAPFLLGRGGKGLPEWVRRLGKLLPPAIMAVLVVNEELKQPEMWAKGLLEAGACSVWKDINTEKGNIVQPVDGGKLCLEEEHAAEHPFGYGRLYAGLALAVALENAMAPLANTVHHTLP